MIDLNHGSGTVYGGTITGGTATRINALIDGALIGRYRRQAPRDYLGGSRIGEPCARRLVYEIGHVPPDEGREFDGTILRIFEAGHRL